MEPKMLVSEAASFLQVQPQIIHTKIKRQNLPHKKNKNRVFFSYKTAKTLFNLTFNPQIISFQIVKGGTGKTSLCLGVGIRANLYGAKTLLVDMDQQGNLTRSFRISASNRPILIDIINQKLPVKAGIVPVYEGLDILPSRIENAVLDTTLILKSFPLDRVYKELFLPLKEEYDLILFDCPPALSSSVTAAALSSDKIIAPVTPSEFSLEGLEITYKHLKEEVEEKYGRHILISPMLNEYDARTTLSSEILRHLITDNRFKNTLIHSFVRKSQEFENAISKGVSIFDTLINTPAKEDIDMLTRELLKLNS